MYRRFSESKVGVSKGNSSPMSSWANQSDRNTISSPFRLLVRKRLTHDCALAGHRSVGVGEKQNNKTKPESRVNGSTFICTAGQRDQRGQWSCGYSLSQDLAYIRLWPVKKHNRCVTSCVPPRFRLFQECSYTSSHWGQWGAQVLPRKESDVRHLSRDTVERLWT